ncbi:hypothetical protein [Haloarcula marina]|uniref:hypothetical protein n=1 Tax=Haloarcula marina TaxID=2961574 RepID=UPI0020B7ACAE|nr:hypothetical protein [Halomicroarcula marina]
MLAICERLSNRLEDEDIRYCHWKSNTYLSESADGEADLDILVDPAEEELVRKLLSELNFKLLQTSTYSNYPSLEDFIGFDARSGTVIHLHLHYRLVLGRPFLKEFRLPWEEQLLTDRVRDEDTGIYMVHPRHELLLLLVRYALKLRWRNYVFEPLGIPLVRGDVRTEFTDLRHTVTAAELERATERLLGTDCVDAVLALYENGPSVWRLRKLRSSLPEVFEQYRRHGKVWGGLVAAKQELQSIAVKGNDKTLGLNFPYQKLVKKGGISVAFIGADGSGKSTVSKRVADEIGWITDTEQIYFGHGDSAESALLFPKRFERWLAAQLLSNDDQQRRSETEGESTENSTAENIKSSPLYTLWDTIAVFSISLDKMRKLTKMNTARNNGYVVITDRYPTVDADSPDSPQLDHWRSSWHVAKRKLAAVERRPYEIAQQYPPDLVIRLSIPPETAVDRKPENTLERAKTRTAQADKIEIPDARVVDIDATQDLDDVVTESMAKIWAAL